MASAVLARLASFEVADPHRIAVTETMWSGVTAMVSIAGQRGLQLVWDSTPDSCSRCASMDDHRVSTANIFGADRPPLHPHCRCIVATTDGDPVITL